MVRLTAAEKAEVVATCDHLARLKYSPVLPFAFTEHGALMLGNVLKASRAVPAVSTIGRDWIAEPDARCAAPVRATAQPRCPRRCGDQCDECRCEWACAAVASLATPLAS